MFLKNCRPLKIRLLQCYEVLWIHNIDSICIKRSPLIYDARNHQKNFEFPTETNISDYEQKDAKLVVTWKDGHVSEFCLQELTNLLSKENVSEPLKANLWNSDSFPENISVDFEDYIYTKDGLKTVLENLCRHGFCFVSNSPKSTSGGKWFFVA